MGEPLRITSHRDEKYSRVDNKDKFDENFDGIHWASSDKKDEEQAVGLTRTIIRDGKSVPLIKNGKRVNKDIVLKTRHTKSGVTMYDILTQPNGPDSEPTTMTDITEAAKAAGITDAMSQPHPEQPPE